MLVSCGDPVQPAAEADQRAGGAEHVSGPVQQPPPAAQRPGVGQVADRLLHQRAQPCLQAVVGPLRVAEPVDGAAVADRRVPVRPGLGQAAEPAVQQAGDTSTSSSASSSPASVRSSCSWQLPGQPPSTHSRSPQMVATATPWAVWACRLASYSTFWLPHSLGRCTRVASPSTSTASPLAVISASQQPSSAGVVMKLPSGWQKPRAASGPSSRSRLSPTSVLEMPTARPARRYDSPSSSTAATASRRTSNASGGVPPWPGGRGGARWARRAASQASTCAGSEERGQYDKGTRPPGRRETPCPWSGPRQHPAAQAITDTLIQSKGPCGGRR